MDQVVGVTAHQDVAVVIDAGAAVVYKRGSRCRHAAISHRIQLGRAGGAVAGHQGHDARCGIDLVHNGRRRGVIDDIEIAVRVHQSAAISGCAKDAIYG